MQTLSEVLAEAIRDFEQRGYISEDQLNSWMEKTRQVMAIHSAFTQANERMFQKHMRSIFDRIVTKGSILKDHAGVQRFTLRNLTSQAQAELNRRILASSQLIRINREEAINKTLKRFSGWATSIPRGGSDNVNYRKVKEEISKPIRSLPFVERRVLIDQGHKLNASISAVLASDGGAIAARWFSHWRQANYDYREDHKERDGHIYLIRNSWASKAGLVKPGSLGWVDEITQPGEEVFCRCKWIYLYNLRNLPADMLTRKGEEALVKSRVKA